MIERFKFLEPDFLEVDGTGKGYICPFCESGSGPTGTGLSMNPRTGRWHCWVCGAEYDVADLWAKFYNVSLSEAVEQCDEYYGLDPLYDELQAMTQNDTIRPQRMNQTQKPEQNFKCYYEKCMKENNYEYLLSRGISEEIQDRFMIGYDANWINTKGNCNILSKRIIIPRTDYNYLARAVDPKNKYQKLRGDIDEYMGYVLFNDCVLDYQETVFIVEGEIDAMSVEEMGFSAIGLCSTSNYKQLINLVEENKKTYRFIIMLDNDKEEKTKNKVENTTQKLKEGLEGAGCICSIATPTQYKDPNDFLQADRDAFKRYLENEFKKVNDMDKPAETNQNDTEYNAKDLLSYFENIEDREQTYEVKTGFDSLDAGNTNLYGGLHEGLYILGAISSLGKTTFILQLANQIAKLGNDVIFFSLEQSKYELIAKSISSETYQQYGIKKENGHFIARTTQQILNSRRFNYFTEKEKEAYFKGIERYKNGAENMYIYEGRYKGERLTVQHMKDIVQKHIEKTGRKPVVFVDYLQIIAPEKEKYDTKANVDDIVYELKELSRKYTLSVIAISSFNRKNYNESVSVESLKESGSLEYSSDIVFGMQYAFMDNVSGEKDAKKKIEEVKEQSKLGIPIPVQLKCLKNRNGTLFSVNFEFMPAFNNYKEVNRFDVENTASDVLTNGLKGF